jgi:hypothetical protein
MENQNLLFISKTVRVDNDIFNFRSPAIEFATDVRIFFFALRKSKNCGLSRTVELRVRSN